MNSQVAETLELAEVETKTSSNNIVDDALSKFLGLDCGHVRGLRFGVTRSKLSLLSQQENRYTTLEKEYLKMREEMMEMKSMFSSFTKKQVHFFKLSYINFTFMSLFHIYFN